MRVVTVNRQQSNLCYFKGFSQYTNQIVLSLYCY